MRIVRNAAYAGLVFGVTIFFALRAFLSYGQGPGVYGAAEADGVLRSFFAGLPILLAVGSWSLWIGCSWLQARRPHAPR